MATSPLARIASIAKSSVAQIAEKVPIVGDAIKILERADQTDFAKTTREAQGAFHKRLETLEGKFEDPEGVNPNDVGDLITTLTDKVKNDGNLIEQMSQTITTLLTRIQDGVEDLQRGQQTILSELAQTLKPKTQHNLGAFNYGLAEKLLVGIRGKYPGNRRLAEFTQRLANEKREDDESLIGDYIDWVANLYAGVNETGIQMFFVRSGINNIDSLIPQNTAHAQDLWGIILHSQDIAERMEAK